MAVEEFKTQRENIFDDKLDAALDKIKPGAEPVEPIEPIKDTPASPDPPPKKEPEPVETPPPAPKKEPETPAPKEEQLVPKEGQKADDDLLEIEPAKIEGFDLKKFNESFETQYEDENTLKSSLKELAELRKTKEEYSTVKADLEKYKADYEEAKTALDPRKYFVNEDEYKRQLILQKYGAEVNPALLNTIVSKDLSQMSDIDVLVLGKMLSNPNIIDGETGAREMVLNQLGIESEDQSEWTTLTKNVVYEAATNSRKSLNEIKNIEVPDIQDYESAKQAAQEAADKKRGLLTDTWGKITDKMMGNFNSFNFYKDKEDGTKESYFDYSVGDEFKQQARDLVNEYLVDGGLEPSEANIKEAQSYMQDLFLRRHANDILQAYGKDVETRVREELEKKIDNPAPPNRQEAPDGKHTKDQELIDYVKEPFQKQNLEGKF